MSRSYSSRAFSVGGKRVVVMKSRGDVQGAVNVCLGRRPGISSLLFQKK